MIDRSPEHMDTILNYLRSGHLSITDRKLIPGEPKQYRADDDALLTFQR